MPETPSLLIIKTGSAPERIRTRHGDFDDWFRRGLGEYRFRYDIIAVDQGHGLPDPLSVEHYAGIVVTGSPAMVSSRQDWSERTAAWLAAVHDHARPLLGVCYGHQLIAHALGGRVGPNPHGRRMGTHALRISTDDDALLTAAVDGMVVHSTHVEAVLEPPPGTQVLASADGDPHHALHFGNRSWGVQFHPEFDADIMRAYVRERRNELRAEGFDDDALARAVVDAPLGDELLTRFAGLCGRRNHECHAVGT